MCLLSLDIAGPFVSGTSVSKLDDYIGLPVDRVNHIRRESGHQCLNVYDRACGDGLKIVTALQE
jgi:hypothetical protein